MKYLYDSSRISHTFYLYNPPNPEIITTLYKYLNDLPASKIRDASLLLKTFLRYQMIPQGLVAILYLMYILFLR